MASYLPVPQRNIPWAPEMLILFWELLQVNRRFRSFIIETDRAHDFVVLVLYYAMSAKDEPAKQGIVRMCVLILQTMSVEPSFGERLNKVFVGQESLPSGLRVGNFHGSYGDFLVTVGCLLPLLTRPVPHPRSYWVWSAGLWSRQRCTCADLLLSQSTPS